MTGVPSSRSIAAIWCDSAGCDMCNTAAALVSEPCSTIVTRHSSALREANPRSCPS
jgi:CelD/BcsL family acetyltransferase involved in cellulose biosynthesis